MIFAPDHNVDETYMDKVVHRSGSRGFSDNGWLKSYFTFSFANYYDPRRINFGALRVLNEDTIERGEGFKSHPHDNMELVVIPIEGGLEHGDNMGNITTVSVGEAYILSAGTGMIHNTYNRSQESPLKYIQLWIFPREYELPPSFSKVSLGQANSNQWQPVVSPQGGEHVLAINQDAWVYMAELVSGTTLRYDMNMNINGVYIFVMKGDVSIAGSALHESDAIGIMNVDNVDIIADTEARILVIEIPLRRNSNPAEE